MSTKDVYLNVLFAYCTQPIHISTTLVHWECVFRLGDVVGQVVWITLWTQSVINPERFDGVRSRLSVMDPLTQSSLCYNEIVSKGQLSFKTKKDITDSFVLPPVCSVPRGCCVCPRRHNIPQNNSLTFHKVLDSNTDNVQTNLEVFEQDGQTERSGPVSFWLNGICSMIKCFQATDK